MKVSGAIILNAQITSRKCRIVHEKLNIFNGSSLIFPDKTRACLMTMHPNGSNHTEAVWRKDIWASLTTF